ncbi:MAG: hypothetical protein ACK4QW_16430 [Alphaproteobacteria bacterium]
MTSHLDEAVKTQDEAGRKVWETPVLTVFDADEAENNQGVGPDGGTFS